MIKFTDAFDVDYETKMDFEQRNDLLCRTIQAHPINLDCADNEDLRITAIHPAVHLDVRVYARLMLQAREKRTKGDIAKASRLEDQAEAVYLLIPKKLRW
jgi:hypothetical protein